MKPYQFENLKEKIKQQEQIIEGIKNIMKREDIPEWKQAHLLKRLNREIQILKFMNKVSEKND